MTCYQNHKDARTVAVQKQIITFISIKPSVNHKFASNIVYTVQIVSKYIWAYSLDLRYLVSGVCFICLVVLCLQVWSLKLEQEVEKNKALTEALQTLATEHHELQQSLCKSRRSSTLSALTEDDFYDAVSGQQPLGGPWSNQEVTGVTQDQYNTSCSTYSVLASS